MPIRTRRGADEPPVAERDAPAPIRPSASAQWLAIAVTVAVSALLALGLPSLAASSAPADTEFGAGERVSAGGVSLETPGGWSLTGGTDLLIVTKQEAKFFVLPPTAAMTSPADSVAQAEAAYGDASLNATLGEVEEFTTESGLAAASVTVIAPDTVTVLYAFSDGTSLATGNLSASPGAWAELREEIAAMAATVELEGAGS